MKGTVTRAEKVFILIQIFLCGCPEHAYNMEGETHSRKRSRAEGETRPSKRTRQQAEENLRRAAEAQRNQRQQEEFDPEEEPYDYEAGFVAQPLMNAIFGDTSDDTDWCFLCDMKQDPKKAEASYYFTELLKWMEENYGENIAPRHYCQQAQNWYNVHLKPYVHEAKEWSLRSIWKHVTKHINSPVYTKKTYRRILKTAVDEMADNMLYEVHEDSGQRRINLKVLAQIRQTMKATKAWM